MRPGPARLLQTHRAMLSRFAAAVLDTIVPRLCGACLAPDAPGALCRPCMESLVPAAGDCCPRCGLIWLTPPAGGGSHTCGPCLATPPPFERARAAWAYGGALKDAITRWKNAPAHALGPSLAALMLEAATEAGWDAREPGTVVVPVPGHPKRIRQRGFHPAGVLARHVARALALPLLPCGLVARRAPRSSQGQGRAARRRRLRGVFAPRDRRLRDRSILLVDDVMTTGATARAATEACLRGGATRVDVALLARTPWR